MKLRNAFATLLMIGAGLISVTVSADDGVSRYAPSGAPMKLWEEQGRVLPFQEYIAAARKTISDKHWLLSKKTEPEHQQIVDAVSPYEWPVKSDCPVDKMQGILLIHGLSDSPYLMRDLGDYLNTQGPSCLLVRSVLLPGHGTYPGDLKEVDYHQWLDAGRYGIESFKGKVNAVHIVGFSTGGAVGLYWAFNPEKVPLAVPLKSLILLSPAIQPKSFLTKIPLLPDLLMMFSKWTGIYEWTDKHPDLDFAKYESFPLNAGYQLSRLDNSLQAIPGKLTIPIYMALSWEDNTIDSKNSIDFFLDRTNADSRMFLVAASSKDSKVEKAKEDNRVTLKTVGIKKNILEPVDPTKNILEPNDLHNTLALAHTSFVNKPDNPHYGENGDYADCLIYHPKYPEKYKQCMPPPPMFTADNKPVYRIINNKEVQLVYGETGDKDVEKNYVLRRLTFNPYFNEMAQQISDFLRSIQK